MRVSPQPQQLDVAGRAYDVIWIQWAIEPSVVGHPGEDSSGHTVGIKEPGRVAEGDTLCTYPSHSAAIPNERFQRLANSGLKGRAGRPDGYWYFPAVDPPILSVENEPSRLGCSKPCLRWKPVVMPIARRGDAVRDEAGLFVTINEDG